MGRRINILYLHGTKTAECVTGERLNLVSLRALQMVWPHSSCANERQSVIKGVREMESWPQREKSNTQVAN